MKTRIFLKSVKGDKNKVLVHIICTLTLLIRTACASYFVLARIVAIQNPFVIDLYYNFPLGSSGKDFKMELDYGQGLDQH